MTGGPRPSAAWRPGSAPPDSEREGGQMVRRGLLPLTLAVAAVAAASLAPIGEAGAANMASVVVRDSYFTPAQQTVHAGDTVIFARAQDPKPPHTVTSHPG